MNIKLGKHIAHPPSRIPRQVQSSVISAQSLVAAMRRVRTLVLDSQKVTWTRCKYL